MENRQRTVARMVRLMRMKIRDILPIEMGFSRLRHAPLEAAGDEKILVYEHAQMRLADFLPDEINPMSFYVLKDHLRFLRELRKDLLDRYAIDILQLKCILHLENEKGDVTGMAPPVVEYYEELVRIYQREGTRRPEDMTKVRIPILYDGIHRAWIAREENMPLHGIVISGALPRHMPYGYPNSWEDVKVCEEKPAIKKNYRRKEAYSFMRPLSVLRQVSDNPASPEWGR